MRPGRLGVRREPDIGACGKVSHELFPLPIEEYAAQVQDKLGAPSAPPHPGTVQAHPHEVPHGSLDGTRPNVQVVLSHRAVVQARAVVAVEADGVVQPLSLALGSWTCLRDRGAHPEQLSEHGLGRAALEQPCLVSNPGPQFG